MESVFVDSAELAILQSVNINLRQLCSNWVILTSAKLIGQFKLVVFYLYFTLLCWSCNLCVAYAGTAHYGVQQHSLLQLQYFSFACSPCP